MADGEDEKMMDENHPFVEKESKHSAKQWRMAVVALVVVVVLLVLSLLAIVGLSVALAIVAHENTSDNCTSNVTDCTTSDCIELAATVLQNMDTSINPCVDFYNYSCGGWAANHALPSGGGQAGVFNELDVNNKIKLMKLLDGDADRGVTAVDYLRNFYTDCLNLTALTVLGAQPLYEVLNYTGGWDLVGIHNATAPNWSISGADFRMSKLLGNPAFFAFGVGVDDKNSSQTITEISQSGLSLPSPDSYQSPYYTSALLNYITSVLTLLNPSGNPTDLQAAAQDIVNFETNLAKIFVSSVALRDPVATYNLFQLEELHSTSQWSQFNWTDFTLEMFKTADVTVDANLTVLVQTPSYLKNLTDLYEATSFSTLENYFKWQLASAYVPYLGANFIIVYYQFTQLVLGVGMQERYITCISVIEKVAPMPLARLFTDYILPPGTRDSVTRLITSIKDAFVQRLTTNDWLDDTTRQRSIWKVGNITQLVAYPKEIDDDDYLLESSKALNLTQGQGYFKTVFEAQLIGSLKNLNTITESVDKTKWQVAPTQVNAYYGPLYNQFVFLEGIMRAPFIVAAWPDYFKLGGMGMVIGHELTHGFDDQGQQYNQDGILTPWWTQESVAEFKRRQTCFVNQYSKYSMFGYNINGNLTLGENIADNGGIKTAYQAYKTIAQNETQQTLPAVDLTPDQLFFVAFGQLWCSIFSPAFIATDLKVNPHSPGPYRVVGSVSNSEEFATAFRCQANAPMNPSNKCDLW